MREEPSTVKKLSNRPQEYVSSGFTGERGKRIRATISLNMHGIRDPVLFTMESGMKWNNLKGKNNL